VSEENVELARRVFALWNVAMTEPDEAVWRAALREMMEQYHPEAELDYARTTPDLVGNREAMGSWIEGARDTYTSLNIEATEFIDAGDAVVMTARFIGQGSASGLTIGGEIAYVTRYRDGQIISTTSFATRREALEAAGLEE
jgi:ketosteroid isomerase-like protein